MSDLFSLSSQHSSRAGANSPVWFNRAELNLILGVYGRLVAQGDCRDYAIGAFSDHAVFSMHQRSSDAPSWTVEKRPSLSRRQGAYSVANASGLILKRGHDLAQVLRAFESKRFQIVD